MMANEREDPGLSRWLDKSSSPVGSPLTKILADMLRSALAWEEENGVAPATGKSQSINQLIEILNTDILAGHSTASGGKQDDSHNGH
jgi:hypothetical protein